MEVKSVIDTVLNVAQVHQGKTIHVATEKREKKCFHHAMEHGIRHFGEGQTAEKKSHLLSSYCGIQHHFEDLKHSLLHMNRENEHFMWDHRTKQYSTILVAATIMISALVAALGQGILEEDSPDLVVMLYSVTTSLSLAFLFVCDVLCIEVIRRGSSFMRHRMSSYRRSLTSAIRKTKEMVHTLRGIDPSHAAMSHQQSPDEDGNIPLRTHQKLGKTIAHMTDEQVEKEFLTHEIDIQRHHDTEASIIESSFPIANGQVATQTFEDFWQENCHTYGLTIILLFYSGSIMMIFANLCFMWATYEFKYESLRGSEVCLHTVTNVVLVTCFILLYMRYEQLDLNCPAISHNHERVGLEDYSWGSIDFVSLKESIWIRFRDVFNRLSVWLMSYIRWWRWQQPSYRSEYVSLSSQARGHGQHATEQRGYGSMDSMETPASRHLSPISSIRSSPFRSSSNNQQQTQSQQPQHPTHTHRHFPISTTEETTNGTHKNPTNNRRSSLPSRSPPRRVNSMDPTPTSGPLIQYNHSTNDSTNGMSMTSSQPSPISTFGTGDVLSHGTNPSMITSSSSSSSSSSSGYPLMPTHHNTLQHLDNSSDCIMNPGPLPFPSINYDHEEVTYSFTTINQQKVTVKRTTATSTSAAAATAAAVAASSSVINPPKMISLSDVSDEQHTPTNSLIPHNTPTFSSTMMNDEHEDHDHDHAEVSSETSSNFSRGSNKDGLLWSAVKMPIHTSRRIMKSNKYQSITTTSTVSSHARGQAQDDSPDEKDDWGAQFLFN